MRTAAAAVPEPSAREKILATAAELFYREGIRAIGVDTIVERSGVAKTSLYRWFPSKDALIAAFLDAWNTQYWEWWDKTIARAEGPRAQLHAILAAIAKRVARPDFRGCPFIIVATEFPAENHPGRLVGRANKAELRRRLRELVAAIGVHDPHRTAEQLAMLIDGAYTTCQALGAKAPAHELVAAAEALIEAGLGAR